MNEPLVTQVGNHGVAVTETSIIVRCTDGGAIAIYTLSEWTAIVTAVEKLLRRKRTRPLPTNLEPQ